MLLPLKHIIRLLLFVFLIGNFVACQSWREAKATIAEADSLLAKGVRCRGERRRSGAAGLGNWLWAIGNRRWK